MLARNVPIVDATDRIVSKVNAVDDGEVAEAYVTVTDVSKVNAVPCVELAVPCVEFAMEDGVNAVPCVGFAVEDNKFPLCQL